MKGKLFAPNLLGAPTKFNSWREQQLAAIMDITSSDRRFNGISAPVGTGKSLIPVMVALLTGSRVLILTETRGLQDQYLFDLSECSWYADIRGAANYHCPALDKGGSYHHLLPDNHKPTCDIGPCKSGMPCKLRTKGCPQYDAIAKARRAQVVTTNYAYHLATIGDVDEDELLGEFDFLFPDEGHAADSSVCSSLAVELKTAIATGAPSDLDFESWRRWCKGVAVLVETRLDTLRDQIRSAKDLGTVDAADLKEQSRLVRLLKELTRIATAKGEWIVQRNGHSTVKLDPVDAAPYCEERLFRHIPRIVVMSATLPRQIFADLGIDQTEYDYFEYDSDFPVVNRPVYVLPYSFVRWNMSEVDEQRWLDGIDAILSSRDDRKAVIHSVSYDRMKKIISRSRHRDRMLTSRGSWDTPRMLSELKKSNEPVIAVHPSIYTGIDLPRCIEGTTKILTTDLRWVQAKTLQVGDRVVGFDEFPQLDKRSRRWCESVVSVHGIRVLPAYRVYLRDGTKIVCSADHKWLTAHGETGQKWTRTKDLRATDNIRSKVIKVLDVCEPIETWGTGYLAAAFDGEGSLYQAANLRSTSQNTVLSLAQCNNEMLFTVVDLLDQMRYDFGVYKKSKNAVTGRKPVFSVHIQKRRNIIRFLSEVRPLRLLPKLNWNRMGAMRTELVVPVDRLEYVGPTPLVAMSTSSRTFIAEGFASHNSDCELQILAKIPFLDQRDPVVKAKLNNNRGWSYAQTMMKIEQAAGRAIRSRDDRAEFFIPDANAGWFLIDAKGRVSEYVEKYATRSFAESLKRVNYIPKAPKSLLRSER